jgi:hypothetical protein
VVIAGLAVSAGLAAAAGAVTGGAGFASLAGFAGLGVSGLAAAGLAVTGGAGSGLGVSGIGVSGLGVSGLAVSGIAVSGIAVSGIAVSGGGPDIGRRAAQQLARRELARSVYQPSLAHRVLSWLSQRIGDLLSSVNGSVPGGWWALIALIVAVVLVVTVVIGYLRPARPGRGTGGAMLAGGGLTAADHRELAERLAAAGDYAGAIIECVRAIAVELEERGVLPLRPGRTAAELAAEAGRALPAHARQLAAAARLFDDVRYGGRDGSVAGYQDVHDLDASLHAARPASASAVTT